MSIEAPTFNPETEKTNFSFSEYEPRHAQGQKIDSDVGIWELSDPNLPADIYDFIGELKEIERETFRKWMHGKATVEERLALDRQYLAWQKS